jgi:membrane protein DedA with SNARE-associated domain
MEHIFATTDQIFDLIAGHSALWIYLAVIVVMIIENFFPPIPGDTFVFVCAVYAAGGNASWVGIYICSIAGTILSVMALYYLGHRQGRAVFASRKLKWLSSANLEKIEHWFGRWGEKLLLASRFLTGIRAALALFAGVGNVHPWKMFIYSLISIASWNFLVVYLGALLRRDWHRIDAIFRAYSVAVYLAFAAVLLALVARLLYRRWKKGQA